MDQQIFIREAKQEDLDAILHLANQLSESVVVPESYLVSVFSDIIGNEQHCLLVAVANEAVVGYASGYFHQAIYAGGLVAFLDEIVVDTSARAMNTGTTLMGRFEQLSRDKGCVLVALATFGAKGFYEKLGYSTKAGYFKKYL